MEPVTMGIIGGTVLTGWWLNYMARGGFKKDSMEINKWEHIASQRKMWIPRKANVIEIKNEILHARSNSDLAHASWTIEQNKGLLQVKDYVEVRMLLSDKLNHIGFSSIREMLEHLLP